MNNASPEKPRRRIRVAAATAVALGATLLAYPGGTASAQSDIDCAALGDDPVARSIASAHDTAIACGVEVRLANYSEAYSTPYVTPSGQLHVVSTADPTGWYTEETHPDPTLVRYDDGLMPTASPWSFWLYHSDPTQPLFFTWGGSLDWAGEEPTPSYSGTTAVYDELATGLDLSVEMDVASAELRFTVESADAWSALATGLDLDAEGDAVLEDGALSMPFSAYGEDYEVQTTPLSSLDATGEFNAVGLALGEDNSLNLSLPEGELETAAFPLTVTTQWAYRGYGIGEWGVVSSAAPDLAAYRGAGAGTDASFLEFSGEHGDAAVGSYCDNFSANPDCATTSEAASYWNFFSGPDTDLLRKPTGVGYGWSFPIAEATFSIDLASDENGMSTCRTPDLVPVAEFDTTVTWNDRPAVTGDAVAAQCEDEVVTYDVTGPVGAAWADTTVISEVAFGMTESAETARFRGGSARLDVYYDIIGFRYYAPDSSRCGTYESSTVFHRSEIPYGQFTADFWRGLEDLDEYSWTAAFVDTDTGATAYTTEPKLLSTVKQGAFWLTAGEIPDGRYGIVYTISSDSTGFDFRSDPCHIAVDTSNPEIIDYTIESGQHYVGEPVSIDVTVADGGFPDGVNTLKVGCGAGNFEPARDEVYVTDSTTVTCEITPTTSDPWLSLWLWDEAGNFGSLDTPGLQATHSRNDFNGDGHQDLMAVREADGNLFYYTGKGDGTFNAGVSKGSGWGGYDVVMAGDLNSDDKADLLARDTKTGYLYLYPGNGTGGWSSRVKVGSGWNGMGAFTSAGDFDGDGKTDLLAVKKSDGVLYLYPGNGNGTFGTPSWVRSQLTSAWSGFDTITAPGDIDGDGYDDFLVRDSRSGAYYVYLNNGMGQFHTRLTVSAALDGTGSDRFRQVVGVGDADGDNYEDLLAIDSRTGELELHALAANGTGLHEAEVVAGSWGGMRLPAADADRTYDYSGDGKTDVLVRRGSDGKLYFYSGNGTGGFGPIGSWGTDLKNLNLIETAGDLNGDGFPDLLGRVASTGSLYLFPGKGNGTYDYAARKQIGTGWNAMGAIVSGHDFNGDGKVDVIAREQSTGYLWLYSGKGGGAIGSRVKIGTGWNAMRDITSVGDLDHDGHADVIAIRSSDNCMYFYGGRGNGTLKAGVKTSCNWTGYDQVASVGDFNGDGHADWIARRKSDGAVYLYKGNGAGGYSARSQIVTGWTWANAIA